MITNKPSTPRAILLSDERTLRRKVRVVASEDTEYAMAIFDMFAAKDGRFGYTAAEWQEILDRVDTCDLTVREWLDNADLPDTR